MSLGRYNIFCATMSMGRFRSAPKIGHLKRLIHISDYLKKYPDMVPCVRFHTEIPDYSHMDHTTYDWSYTVSMVTPPKS